MVNCGMYLDAIRRIVGSWEIDCEETTKTSIESEDLSTEGERERNERREATSAQKVWFSIYTGCSI